MSSSCQLDYEEAVVIQEEIQRPSGRKQRSPALSNPQPRLRWTQQLHERFLKAVNQLGGIHKARPRSIVEKMRVTGITVFHVKSHLQKYRRDLNSGKELPKPPRNDGFGTSVSAPHHVGSPSIGTSSRREGTQNLNINQGNEVDELIQAQLETRRRANLQAAVDRHLQISIEAQQRYMDAMLEQAYKMFNDQNLETPSRHGKGKTRIS